MAVALSKPVSTGSNIVPGVDDVRRHRLRIRRLSFSGTYATGGNALDASVAGLGLKRIIAVIPLNGGVVRAANGVTGELAVVDINTAGTQFTVRLLEDAAGVAGATFGAEKNNAEAHVANSFLDVLVIGY